MGEPPSDRPRPPESDEELVEFIANAPVSVCWVDPAGRLLWANRACLDLLASSAHEDSLHSIVGYFVEPQVAYEVLGRLRRQETLTSLEASLRARDGSVRRVLIDAGGLFRAGRLVHSRWMLRDVSALLEREQAVRHHALDATRLRDEFLALLSHEMRTPLGAILVWLGLLRQAPSDPTETARALEIIERSARTLERIIEDLLHASRIAAGGLMLTPQLVDLRGVVQVATDAASADAAIKGLLLDSPDGDVPIWVRGDPGRLQQAVSNLLSNAVKFTPTGGRIAVSLDTEDRQARLRIRDTGEGMNPAFLPFAFDRFRQQDGSSTRVHHGLGLGLYVVRHLVDHHGGVVSAESPGPGRGSTFTVRLPLAPAPDDAVGPPADQRAPERDHRPRAGLSVLLVDDEEDAREALRRILQQNGMIVTVAASAREAYEIVERVQPDILLSDIAMPGEDGLALIRRVRMLPLERGGRIPAIALSAYAGEADRRAALLAGFQSHVSKPVEPDRLLAVMARTIRGGGDPVRTTRR